MAMQSTRTPKGKRQETKNSLKKTSKKRKINTWILRKESVCKYRVIQKGGFVIKNGVKWIKIKLTTKNITLA